MAAAAMPGGTTPPSPLRPPAPSLSSPYLPALSHRSRTPSPLSTKMDQGDEASGELEQHPVGTGVLESPASSKKKRVKSGDTCVERQVTHDSHLEQRHGSEAPGPLPSSGKRLKKVAITNSQEISRSLTAGSKRPASHESGSIRASKAAKVIDDKVVITQLQNKYKTTERKKSPIICGSPGINMLARKRAQSHASSPRSPSLRHESPVAPNSTESPSLHDLSPAAPHGSIRRPRKLTSIIWNDADPIYIGGQLMQGKCKHCKNIFPASKVSGSSQLGRHLKVCEVKCSMDGLMEKIRTSDE